MSAIIIGFVTAFSMASVQRYMIKEIVQQSKQLHGLNYSCSLFSTATQCNVMQEMRLSIEVAVVREANAKFKHFNLARSEYKLVDMMTKNVKKHLCTLLDTRIGDHPVEE
jgi:malate/lactate dehydrogenase